LRRYAAKRDIAELEVVSALESIGVLVWRMDVPCDLLCFWRGRFFCLEVKTGKRGTRACQVSQGKFLALTGTPIVRSGEQAIIAAEMAVRVERPCLT